MNTYNENLRASVAKALQSLDMDLKKVNTSANAAMFTLYYAQGATFSAMAKLDKAKESQDIEEGIKTQAVDNSNLSGNMLKTATQAGDYLKQSVSNVSVCASNVQGSANAIVRLSGDVGNIYNIVNAADYDTDIYKLADKANRLIKETAYSAERASQLALESSVLTSQVSAATVQDNSKKTNDAVNALLKIITGDYDKISQQVTDDNAGLAAVSTSEKAAEGVYEDLRTVSLATGDAYKATNDQLNLALAVPENTETTFKVQFNSIYSPFFEKDKKFPYPVDEYYLIVVKDKQKSTFSINTAEDIKQNYPERCLNLVKDFKKHKPGPFEKTFDYTSIPVVSDDSTDESTYHLHDSEGDELTTGTAYVVFLFAVYDEEYKKKLNTYDDFLSAPSTDFTFTILLQAAKFDKAGSAPPSTTAGETVPESQAVAFHVDEREDIAKLVEYRCVFLPAATALTSGLMDEETLAELDEEIRKLRLDANKLEPQILELKNDLIETSTREEEFRKKYEFFSDIEQYLHQNMQDLPKLTVSIKKQEDGIKKLIIKLKDNIPELNDNSGELKEDLPKMVALVPARQQAEVKLAELEQEQTKALTQIEAINKDKIDFIFNLALALQLNAGSYTKAQPNGTTRHESKDTTNWIVPITPATTDNFGNVLVKGKPYIPVVLSVSTAQEEMQSRFTNNWTGYQEPDNTIIIK